MADRKETKEKEFIDHVINVRRVTKVTKGGKRFSFSAFVVSGDEQGKVGIALGKSREVSQQLQKQQIVHVKIWSQFHYVAQLFLMK